MSKFQVTITALFIIFIIAGVTLFATYKGSSNTTETASINIWGTFPSSVFDEYISKINSTRSSQLKIDYTEISESSFDKTFIEALARGRGPDAILVNQDSLYRHSDKVIPIPFDTLPQRNFQDTFIQQSELYLTQTGVLALPFVVDPIVMYWNRDSFTNAGVSTYPKFWDEFTKLNVDLTQKDVNSNIRKSAIALGEFSNVLHAREILGTLFLQSGNSITFKTTNTDDTGITLSSALGSRNFDGIKTSQPALDFFTQFSNPSGANYSWNRSLPSSRSSFLSGNLATYFGFASEVRDLREKNPNLNFDVAPMPQARGGKNRATYGAMYGLSIVRSAVDPLGTFTTLSTLVAPDALAEMVTASYLPPVRRDMIGRGSLDLYLSIFYDSALISRGWLDTDKMSSNNIFRSIVESVTSGKKDSRQALQDGSDEYDILLKSI
jgi:ABC-type glycerol-3-phosphate transport system substrate-binding protein